MDTNFTNSTRQNAFNTGNNASGFLKNYFENKRHHPAHFVLKTILYHQALGHCLTDTADHTPFIDLLYTLTGSVPIIIHRSHCGTAAMGICSKCVNRKENALVR